jgi:hypothetical protein
LPGKFNNDSYMAVLLSLIGSGPIAGTSARK